MCLISWSTDRHKINESRISQKPLYIGNGNKDNNNETNYKRNQKWVFDESANETRNLMRKTFMAPSKNLWLTCKRRYDESAMNENKLHSKWPTRKEIIPLHSGCHKIHLCTICNCAHMHTVNQCDGGHL